MIKNVYWSPCHNSHSCQILMPHFDGTSICSTNFRKIIVHQISLKSVYWEPSCSTRRGEQTDMKQPTDAFRNFANATKNRMPLPVFKPRTAQQIA
jgi:hypothetical protein